MLFTHRGLSGPAILQISSVWREGDEIVIDFCPGIDLYEALINAKTINPKQLVKTVVSGCLPRRLADRIATNAPRGNIADIPDKRLSEIAAAVNRWRVKPAGSEGSVQARHQTRSRHEVRTWRRAIELRDQELHECLTP